MALDVMIDLESLSTDPNCVILSIGLVSFDVKGNGVVEKIELKPTIDDQTDVHNRVISESTLKWWGEQNEDAINEAFSESDRIPFDECMEMVYKFCWNKRAVWSNGASFDVVACENGFRQTLKHYPNPIPWPYYTVRDTRTLYEIAGVSLKDKKYGTKTTHKAVEDAEHQAIVVQDAYKKLIEMGVRL